MAACRVTSCELVDDVLWEGLTRSKRTLRASLAPSAWHPAVEGWDEVIWRACNVLGSWGQVLGLKDLIEASSGVSAVLASTNDVARAW